MLLGEYNKIYGVDNIFDFLLIILLLTPWYE